MSDATTLFTVGSAPHWRAPAGITKRNLLTIAALLPTTVVGAASHAFGDRAVTLSAATSTMNSLIDVLVVELGLNAGVLWFLGILGTVALGMGLGVFFEYALQVAMRQPYRATDGHGALMGLLLALMMPPSIPWWTLAIGVFVAIFIGKQIFGGIGCYPMHPVVVGWLVLLLSWPNHLFPVGSASIAAAGHGALAATVLGGIVLWLFGIIRPQISLGVLIGVAVVSLVFAARLKGSPVDQILTGHVLLAAFFIATDPTSSPANRKPMWLFGLGVGLLIGLIRGFGVWPDAIPFAVMLMNVVTPLLDRWHRPPHALRVPGWTANASGTPPPGVSAPAPATATAGSAEGA